MSKLEPFMDDESFYLQLSQDTSILSSLCTEIVKELQNKPHVLYGPMSSIFTASKDSRITILKNEAKRVLSRIMFFIAIDDDIQPKAGSVVNSGNDIIRCFIAANDSIPTSMKNSFYKELDKMVKKFVDTPKTANADFKFKSEDFWKKAFEDIFGKEE